MHTKLSVVSNKGLHIFEIDGSKHSVVLNDSGTVYESSYDSSGKYFAYCTTNGAYLLNLSEKTPKQLSDSTKFRKIQFSPKGSFVTFFAVRINGEPEQDNVFIYRTSDFIKVHSYKHAMTGLWPFQWSDDEKIAMKVNKSEVHVYKTENYERYDDKLSIKGLDQALLAQRGSDYFIGVFVKSSGGMPHMVKIYNCRDLKDCINNRSFFKANEVTLYWHPKGKSLLFMSHVETLTNYYGEDTLYYISAEPNGETAIVSMPKKDDLIQGVTWRKGNGDKFLVMYGNPLKIGVYNDKCVFLYNMDTENRNLCVFSSCGNMLALAGTGNIRQSIQLWDFNNKKIIGELDVQDVNRIKWSSNDRYLVTATVSPSLRVNNGFIIWKIDSGELVLDKTVGVKLINDATEVYSVEMLPESQEHDYTFCKSTISDSFFYFDKSLTKHDRKKVTDAKAYVPPHLRNRPNTAQKPTEQPKNVITTKNGCAMTITGDHPNANTGTGKKKKNRNKNKNKNNEVAK